MTTSHNGKIVLDTAALLAAHPVEPGRALLPSAVLDEVRKGGRVPRFLDGLLSAGASVLDPTPEARARAQEAAQQSGDAHVLSGTDVDVAALAWEHDAVVMSDDLAVQNLCHHLDLEVQGVTREVGKARTWKVATCTGCRKEYKMPAPDTCEVCGAPIKRGHAKRGRQA